MKRSSDCIENLILDSKNSKDRMMQKFENNDKPVNPEEKDL